MIKHCFQSAIPEVLRLFDSAEQNDIVSQVAAYIRTFKILRSLKMVGSANELRITHFCNLAGQLYSTFSKVNFRVI